MDYFTPFWEGFRTIAFDHRGHGLSELGDGGHSLENLAEDVKTIVLGLDLHDAVLVGHSMGGVAVQEFVTRYPELAAERVAGIVLLSTLAYTPFGSRSTRTKARIEKLTKRTPDARWLWERPNLGLLAARLCFGTNPHPSHVELVRRMMVDCAPETPRRASHLDRPRSHRSAPEHSHSDTRHRWYRGCVDATSGGAANGEAHPGRSARAARGWGHMLMLERTEQLNRLIVDFAGGSRGSAALGLSEGCLHPGAGRGVRIAGEGEHSHTATRGSPHCDFDSNAGSSGVAGRDRAPRAGRGAALTAAQAARRTDTAFNRDLADGRASDAVVNANIYPRTPRRPRTACAGNGPVGQGVVS
jgi:pimeloyl-ACP methyl ester carboxylesterase